MRYSLFQGAELLLSPLLVALALIPLACSGSGEPEGEKSGSLPLPGDYPAEVETWHRERVEGLRKETSWLTLVGLFWLKEGENSFGSAADNDLVFPASAPARIGNFLLVDGKLRFEAEAGVVVTLNGDPVTALEVQSDADGEPTYLDLGRFQIYAIDRGGRIGVRLKDREAPARLAFEGIERFSVESQWRIEAKWEAYEPAKKIEIANILGQISEEECPGAAVFELDGETFRLEPTGDLADLFLVFGDATNAKETYGGGRFLVLAPPENGKIVVDFNQAYNPPCVFSPYATCPLPPRQNKLSVAVTAGEKTWKHHIDPTPAS